MPRSSIFSFDTLTLTRQDGLALGATMISACVFLCMCEAVLRLDSTPKSLPFRNTREGTLMDVLSRPTHEGDGSPKAAAADRDGSTPASHSLELLFLGSSQCAYNISPLDVWSGWEREGPVRALNLGMEGCNIRTVAAFCDEFPERLQAPIMVFVCAPYGTQGPLVRDAINTPGRDYLKGLLAVPEQCLMQMSAFRYRRQYRDLRYQYYLLRSCSWNADLDRRLGPFRCGWRPGQGNFLAPTDFNTPGESQTQSDRITLESIPEVWEALSSTIRRVAANRCKVVCLVPPQPPRFDNTFIEPNSMWESFLNDLTAVCEAEGAVMIDHHQLVDFGDSSFFDHTHLKNDDARRYSRFLGQQLRELGL